MDIDNVNDPGDIAAAAATMREQGEAEAAAAKEKPTPEATPPAAEEPTSEEPTPEEGKTATGTERPDPEADWKAEADRRTKELDAKEAKLVEDRRLSDERISQLLADDTELDRVRTQLGIKKAPVVAPVSTDPDPMANEAGWKAAQIVKYLDHYEKKGQELPPMAAIREAVGLDYIEAKSKSIGERQAALERRIAEREAQEKDQAAKAASQRALDERSRQIDVVLAKHPELRTDATVRDDVEGQILLALHKGQKPDVEAIVKRVADRARGAVKNWTEKKKGLAAGAAPAQANGGGQAPAPGSMIDEVEASPQGLRDLAQKIRSNQV